MKRRQKKETNIERSGEGDVYEYGVTTTPWPPTPDSPRAQWRWKFLCVGRHILRRPHLRHWLLERYRLTFQWDHVSKTEWPWAERYRGFTLYREDCRPGRWRGSRYHREEHAVAAFGWIRIWD